MKRLSRILLAAFLLALLCAEPLYAAPAVFGSAEFPAPATDPWQVRVQPMWQRVLDAESKAPGFTADGRHFRPVDQATWRNLVAYAKTCPEMEKLRLVSGFFNQWRPKNDADTWNTPEHWASPKEFLAQRGGDCEDYAIAKYFALRFLGLDASRMRIVIVRHLDENGRSRPEMHAVLAVFANNVWFILDNNARPKNNIFPDYQYKGRFVPLYSMNESGTWTHEAKSLR